MKPYVLYDAQGVIQSQGAADERHLRLIEATLVDLEMLVVDNHLDDTSQWRVEQNQLLPVENSVKDFHYSFLRNKTYDIGEQLGLLYKDIDAGLFGSQAKNSSFYQYVKSIKEQYPKP